MFNTVNSYILSTDVFDNVRCGIYCNAKGTSCTGFRVLENGDCEIGIFLSSSTVFFTLVGILMFFCGFHSLVD